MQSEVGSSPCLFRHCQHRKARAAAATKGGGPGRGGLHPHSGNSTQVGWGSSSIPVGIDPNTPVSPSSDRQQTHGRGVTPRGSHTLGVPHAGGPSLPPVQGQDSALGVQPLLPLCPVLPPQPWWDAALGPPVRGAHWSRGEASGTLPPFQLPPDPQKRSGKFLPNRPRAPRGRNGSVTLPWQPAGPRLDRPRPLPEHWEGGRVPDPHRRGVGAQSISRRYPCAGA